MTVATYPDIQCYSVKSENGMDGIKQAFDKLESYFENMSGRKFYGMMYGAPPEMDYWAMAAIEDGDDQSKFPPEHKTIPGGKYVEQKVEDWPKNIDKIGETFRSLIHSNEKNCDWSRPCVEFYRSASEMVCRVPVV